VSALLDDIINLAIDGSQPLPDILRKCLLLGHELKNQQLKDWANQELNGYESGKDVPESRILSAIARGNFMGPFQAQRNSWLIPALVLEESHRAFAETVYLTQSVSAYADVLKQREKGDKPSSGHLTFEWDPNMVVYYQEKMMQGGFICYAAWQEVPVNAIVEMLDTIRNRTLKMALQIKDELGTSYVDLRKIESGDTESKIQSIIFQNTGGNTTVAFGQASVDASQHQMVIAVGDRKALDEALTKAGLEKPDLDALTEAIQADGEKPGNTVGEWIKKNGQKVLAGGVKVGTQIGQEILSAWIKAHYGIH
jgi:hypothetical protein